MGKVGFKNFFQSKIQKRPFNKKKRAKGMFPETIMFHENISTNTR